MPWKKASKARPELLARYSSTQDQSPAVADLFSDSFRDEYDLFWFTFFAAGLRFINAFPEFVQPFWGDFVFCAESLCKQGDSQLFDEPAIL